MHSSALREEFEDLGSDNQLWNSVLCENAESACTSRVQSTSTALCV